MQTNVYPDSPDYVFITIIDHHQEYQLPHHPRIQQRTMWDGSDVSRIVDLYVELFQPDLPYDKPNYQRVSDEKLWAILQKRCFTEPNALPDLCEPISIDDVSATIYRIEGHIPDLNEWAKQFAIDMKRECHNVGGDDGYYDYFPTFHYMFYMICRELSLRELYDSTIKYVMTDPQSQYHDDDEETIQNYWTE